MPGAGIYRTFETSCTKQCICQKRENSTSLKQEHSMMLRNELAMPGYCNIKGKLRKISMITEKTIGTGHGNPKQSLMEIRNLLEELHEFGTMIKHVDSMILRGYFYTCLDHLKRWQVYYYLFLK